ncbi:hypothetical protein [Sphaerochaeta sp.]|uniref:hypothetical protein n=1 Tax=Sphaerochaeta sp. TaxID=1972642 RepID=UPI002FC5CD0B
MAVLLLVGAIALVGCDGNLNNSEFDLDQLMKQYDEWGQDTEDNPYIYFAFDSTSFYAMDVSWEDDNGTPTDTSDDTLIHYSIEVDSYTDSTITGHYTVYDSELDMNVDHPITVQITYNASSGLSLSFSGPDNAGLEGKSYNNLQPCDS